MRALLPSRVEERKDRVAPPPTLGAAELERLMDEHGPAVLKLARSYLGDAVLAEDVFQEVFVQAFRSASAVRDPRALRSWLLSVTANRCRDHLRSWTRRYVAYVSELPERPHEDPRFEEVESDRELAEAVFALPLPFREVVLLHYYEQLSVPEVARALRVPSVTVRTRLHRARKLLRRALREEAIVHA